ncbi:MAG: hypothetical protein IKE24_02135 [Clostridia bacterium]|nr:hypothetical protein [Clostridia bacterium]
MKKILSLILTLTLVLGLAAFAGAEEYTMKVTAPAGAPALALAALAVEAPENYSFVAADTIAAAFAANEADFVIAPLNAGARLYKAGKSTYKMAAVVCWGNLYFASQKADFQLSDLNGAALTLFGEGTVNASIALYVLEKNGIVPASVAYLAGAADTQKLLLTDESAIVLTAEPALTAASMNNDKVSGIALNDLYKEATGYEGFTQAALFVRAETAQAHPEEVNAYLEKVAESCAKCESDLNAVAEAAVALEILPKVPVALKAIPGCAIRFVAAKEAKEQVEITAGIDLSQYGGDVPADDFYYGE